MADYRYRYTGDMAECRHCGAPIEWAATRRSPLPLEPGEGRWAVVTFIPGEHIDGRCPRAIDRRAKLPEGSVARGPYRDHRDHCFARPFGTYRGYAAVEAALEGARAQELRLIQAQRALDAA